MKGFVKFMAALGVTMLLMLMFRALFFTVFTVPNKSLEPQFLSGDRILVNRCSYGLRTGEDTPYGYSRWIKQQIVKGDITAFNYPIDNQISISDNPVYVGCCIAVPGDTVRISRDFKVVVPGRGVTIKITDKNAVLMCNMLRMHEHRDSYMCNGKLYVSGIPVSSVTFEKDYYWMSSFSMTETDDSRFFGFVPEDHVVGRVVMLVYSRDRDKPLHTGFRWDRFLKLL